MSFKRTLALSVGVPLAAILSACGGGGSDVTTGGFAPQSADLTLAADALATGDPAPIDARVKPDPTAKIAWQMMANSATLIPNGGGRAFNSFNQPSVNAAGLVVMRARSKGGGSSGGGGGGEGEGVFFVTADGGGGGGGGGGSETQPVHGIYTRDMAKGGELTLLFDGDTTVPQPNNTMYSGVLSTFTEFPAFPRIGADSTTIATRAQSTPVYTWMLPDGTETRAGTSGVYAFQNRAAKTVFSQLGVAPGLEYFAVPGAAPGTRFDQFPGAPAIGTLKLVATKGNYTENLVGKTGIFWRDLSTVVPKMNVIASSDTLIPGQPADGVRFGSTAPPSAYGTQIAFLGLDNEDAPTMGGVYLSQMTTRPTLRPLVTIGAQVPGEPGGTGFTRLGEALSFGNQFIGFWGAWGADTRSVLLICPVDGNKDLVAYCNTNYPAGHTVQVPVNQGFFVYDLSRNTLTRVASTGADFQDFTYWVFSGRAPGVGGDQGGGDSEDYEPPRWRFSAFISSWGLRGEGQVVFKGRRAGFDTPVDGIYLQKLSVRSKTLPARTTLVETGMAAQLFDAAAPAGATVTTMGLEREALRNGWLAIAVGMLDSVTSEGWAGVYVQKLR